MLEHLAGLRCLRCERTFRPALRALCPDCPDGGQLRLSYATDRLQGLHSSSWAQREPWLWRYLELLPFDPLVEPPPLQVGHTPLYGSARLATYAGVRGVYVKDESRNPTGRTADRAAALLVAGGAEARGLVTGELFGPLAAFAASAGAPLWALLRPGEDGGSARNLGAKVLVLDPALDRREALLRLRGEGRYLSDRPNPLAFEGLKTLGLEVGEQLAERLPDWVVLDAEEPELVEAVTSGLEQLRELGFFRLAPKILAVDGAGGGDLQVSTSEPERLDAAQAATRALGLALTAEGAAPLAGLRRAVAEGSVAAECTALVVVQGEAARGRSQTFPEGEVMRSFEAVLAAVRG